jgi:hypothetical protein
MYGLPSTDMLYLAFALPGLLLGLWAQLSLKGTFLRYAAVATSTGFGAECFDDTRRDEAATP